MPGKNGQNFEDLTDDGLRQAFDALCAAFRTRFGPAEFAGVLEEQLLCADGLKSSPVSGKVDRHNPDILA